MVVGVISYVLVINGVLDLDTILGDLAVTIIKGPLGVLLGVVYGFAAGILLWYLPGKDSVSKVMHLLNHFSLIKQLASYH